MINDIQDVWDYILQDVINDFGRVVKYRSISKIQIDFLKEFFGDIDFTDRSYKFKQEYTQRVGEIIYDLFHNPQNVFNISVYDMDTFNEKVLPQRNNNIIYSAERVVEVNNIGHPEKLNVGSERGGNIMIYTDFDKTRPEPATPQQQNQCILNLAKELGI